MKPYDYKNRRGVKQISWQDFADLVKSAIPELARYNPDLVLGVIRGGLYPATYISHILQKELYPIRLTRRYEDKVVYNKPRWIIKPTDIVRNKKVLVVDDICDTGETLEIIKEELEGLDATDIKTFTIYSHFHGKDKVDYCSLVTDELIINPWDKELFDGSAFISNPEYPMYEN